MEVLQALGRTPRHVRRWLPVPGAAALIVVAALVWQSSYAGFSATTRPLPATVGTGTVKLSNSVSAVGAAVSLGEVLPGSTATYCIVVNSTGSAPAELRLYARAKSATKSLDQYFSLSWVAGTGGGAYGDCTGFVATTGAYTATLSGFPTTWAGGVLPWTITGNPAGENRSYQMTYTVARDAPVTTKGGSLTATFVWEAQTR